MKPNTFLLAIISLFILVSSCTNNSTDENIQQNINDVLKKDNAGAALNATVDNGVATITGECSGANCSAIIAEKIKKIKGVQSVETHIIEKP